MRIASMKLENFKRFTHLTIQDIPQSAKLVLVVGPNGCGKSSLFDALAHWHALHAGVGWSSDELYYRKDHSAAFDWSNSVRVVTHDDEPPQRGCVYLRTAFRNDPDFSVRQLHKPENPTSTNRLPYTTMTDKAIEESFKRLLYDVSTGVFDPANGLKTVETFRQEKMGHIRASLQAVFPDLNLSALSDPLGIGSFTFDKGTATAYHFKNLSGGERGAFDLILDLHLKKKFYGDAVYCIDEVDTHLHTAVQGPLVRELVRIVPDNGQLWITTHSLGVLREAQRMANNSPGSVCIIDFTGSVSDAPTVLTPTNLDRVAWQKFLSVAIDDLSIQVGPSVVIVCEGSSVGTRRKDFDAQIYDKILGSQYPGWVFVSGGESTQIAASGAKIKNAVSRMLPSTKVFTLTDRDAKSPQEVAEIEQDGGLVLPKRNIESYLLADDVLDALLAQEGKSNLQSTVHALVVTAFSNSIARNNAADDYKSAAGEIVRELRRTLTLNQGGNTTDSFMRDTLAPLIRPGMQTYDELKAAIIDPTR